MNRKNLKSLIALGSIFVVFYIVFIYQPQQVWVLYLAYGVWLISIIHTIFRLGRMNAYKGVITVSVLLTLYFISLATLIIHFNEYNHLYIEYSTIQSDLEICLADETIECDSTLFSSLFSQFTEINNIRRRIYLIALLSTVLLFVTEFTGQNFIYEAEKKIQQVNQTNPNKKETE